MGIGSLASSTSLFPTEGFTEGLNIVGGAEYGTTAEAVVAAAHELAAFAAVLILELIWSADPAGGTTIGKVDTGTTDPEHIAPPAVAENALTHV